jgi:hypothetical protein
LIIAFALLAGCSQNEQSSVTPQPTMITQSPSVTVTPMDVTLSLQVTEENINITKTPEPAETLTVTLTSEQESSSNEVKTPLNDLGDNSVKPEETPEIQPSPTPSENENIGTEDCFEKAAFFSDVTIPDETFFNQAEPFTKTWRFRNEGSCTWTTDYAIVFHSGDNMSAPIEIPFPETVFPGDLVDLSVDMKAPTRDGQHRSNWEFKKPSGEHFGVGSTGKDLFWVLISVRFLDENDQSTRSKHFTTTSIPYRM